MIAESELRSINEANRENAITKIISSTILPTQTARPILLESVTINIAIARGIKIRSAIKRNPIRYPRTNVSREIGLEMMNSTSLFSKDLLTLKHTNRIIPRAKIDLEEPAM